ncbi:formin-like protein 11 isoform X1 [Daucus carota subsp. sativus]|uniref:formin-like protein 11 isoform X1 n=2 Tax=Daucus carota subsp. sativus TaxID=79200 RepID=UPI0007EFFCB5|nr:PREDICTED: formin-like protein 11 isoform X1 [Daucus carota subsp. sativus]
MVHASQILHMIVFIFFMLTPLMNAAMLFNGDLHVLRVSGEEENKGLVFEKISALLGLGRFYRRKQQSSPVEAPALAPAPAPIYHHAHSHHRHSHRARITAPRRRRINKERSDQGIVTRNIVVLFIVSASLVFVLLGIVFIWGCKKFRKTRKETSKMAILHSSDIENYRRSKGVGIIEKVNKEMARSEAQNVGCPAVGDIGTGNSVEKSSVGCGSQTSDEKTLRDACLADDESFQSPDDIHSANARFSNASAEPLSDTSETVLQFKPSSPMASSLLSSLQPPPPPPPPPPPLNRIHMFPSTSRPGPTTLTSAALSSAFSNLMLTSKGDQFSESSQKSENNLKDPSKIPQRFPPTFTQGPPPPPSPLEKYSSLDKDGNQLPKLKPLHWDKVRTAPDHSMVWDKIRSSSFEFDEEMIESLFGYDIKYSSRYDEAKSPSPKKHILEPKRLQNITILSKALNVSADHICEALRQGAGLGLQQLEALIKMELTKEEEGMLTSYQGDIDGLGSAEKILKTILHIPFAFPRIEAMIYRETFEDEIALLRNSFSMLEDGCKELRSSRLFLKLLEAVLKTGNRMNIGTVRGGARAFKLDALLKLADVKGADGKTTLLHFVVKEIIRTEGIKASDSIIGKINQKNRSQTFEDREEAYREMGLDLVSGLTSELFNVRKTANIDFDAIASSLSNLFHGLAQLQHLVQTDLSKEEMNGSFVLSMRTFISYAEKKLKEMKEDKVRVLVLVREMTEYFHGNVSTDESNPLRIFVVVRDFLGMLDHVCKEIRNSKAPPASNRLAPFQ